MNNEKAQKYYLNYLKKENLYNEKIYQKGIKKLNKGYPVQYIIGNVDFYGNIIKVNKNVLIPRFETEQLIEKTTKYINQIFKKENIKIIDLGTGSGCIAITLKKIFPNSKIDAIDISKKALNIAQKNAKANNTKINFKKQSMEKKLKDEYDIIISNPPYLKKDEKIMDIVKKNEPKKALYAKNEGLYFYEKIIKNLKDKQNKYLLAFEIGENQSEKIKKIANKYLQNIKIIIEKDYNNKNRFIFIIKN